MDPPLSDYDSDTSSENEEKENQIQEEQIKTKVSLAASVAWGKIAPKTTHLLEEAVPKTEKVNIRFVPIGSIAAIQPKVFKISTSQPFSTLIRFLDKKLKIPHVFCYIHNSFAPSPDENIGNLYNNFSVGNELIVSYCNTVAFG